MHSGFSSDKLQNALWVTCEGSKGTLDDTAKIDDLISFAMKNKIDTLFIQVYRGNRTWYVTDMADDGPAQKFLKANGFEMLPYLLKKAHKNQIAVHAWFNILRITKNKQAYVLKKYGEKIVTRDSQLRSLLEYPDFDLPEGDKKYYEMGDPGIWLDAGNTDVKTYICDLIRDFLFRYSEIDGIHLDFIRLPVIIPFSPGSRFKGLSFGYGYESMKKFREEYGFDPLEKDITRIQSLQWDNFRREQITDIVRKIKKICCTDCGKKLSAAVRPWIDRAYLTDCQDWPRWLEEGLLDFAVVMNYTDDFQLFKYLALCSYSLKSISSPRSRILTGIGVYLLNDDAETLEKEIRFLKKIKADGISVFSYDSIEDPETVYSIINE